MTKEDYNNEPVSYCSSCLSLEIKEVDGLPDLAMCQDCGNTDIESCHIDEWNEKYVTLYGNLFLTNNGEEY